MLDCKEQILFSIPKSKSCSQTFINTILFVCSQVNKYDNSILISCEKPILEKLNKIISSLYPEIVINAWDSFLMLKGNIYTLLTDLNFADFNLSFFEKESDKITLLKTAFLLAGSLRYNKDNNENSTGYTFEISVRDKEFLQIIKQKFSELNFDLRIIKRQQNYVLYTKNSSLISDILVTLGASATALDIQNMLVIREIRNQTNRQNNCFESNLDKTIQASDSQIEAINYIIKHHSIDYFDDNLKEVALVRLANPEVSLNDLKLLLNNKISRVGIKYRLDKIISIYKKLKGEQ